MLANRPGKFQEIYNIKSHELLFQDRVRNCEDVVLDEEKGVAFLSCDEGRDRWNTVMVSDYSLDLRSSRASL
jgi:arylesterase/paraoxonase